jgi:hypothetical protein
MKVRSYKKSRGARTIGQTLASSSPASHSPWSFIETYIFGSSVLQGLNTSKLSSMAHPCQQTRCVDTRAARGAPSLCLYAPIHSNNTNPPLPTGTIQQSPYSSPPASHSSNSLDSALSQSTLHTPTDPPPKSSKTDQSARQSQTSLSPFLPQARTSTPVATSSSGSSKTKFLKAIFDRKRKASKQASQDSLSTAGSSSQTSPGGPQAVPSVPGSALQKSGDSTQPPPPPQASFADLMYRYGGPTSKPPRL